MAALCAGLACAAEGVADPAAEVWPVEPPPDAQTFEVAAHAVVDGVPMRILGFVSAQGVQDNMAWFKAKLGSTAAVSQIGRRRVLGGPSGASYLTVELEPAASGGTRGTIALADWAQARATAREYQDTIHRLQDAFGERARVLQHTESVDGDKRSRYVVLTNDQPVQLNMSEARRWLEAQGLQLERSLDARAADVEAPTGRTDVAPGITSFFRGPGKQAIAVATQDPQMGAVVVINLVETAK
jgi:hypothetical protein